MVEGDGVELGVCEGECIDREEKYRDGYGGRI